jgi:small-conductance mechanosensitive channel
MTCTFPALPMMRWVRLAATIFCLLALAAPMAFAQAPATQPPGEHPASSSAAPALVPAADVVVLNRKVALMRVPFLGISPAERAKRAEQTIAELLAKGGPGEVTVQQVPQGSVLLIDGGFALILVPDDADRLRGETLDALTQSVAQKLSRAIADTREARDQGRLLRAAVYSGVATLIFAVALWGIWRLRRALIARTADLLESTAGEMQLAGMQLWHSSRLRVAARWLVGVVIWLVIAGLAYEWLVYVLNRFAYTRPWGEQLGAFLLGILQHVGGGALRALPDLMVAVVIFILARGVIAMVKPMFDRVEHGYGSLGWLDRDLAAPTRRIFAVAVWLFAVAMAYPYLPGAQSDAFKGISVLVGLMLTLGGSSLMGQGFSGLILMYSRTIRVGEYVRINDQEGTVTELGTFTTKIRTGLGEEISLPNSLIMSSITKNYSRTIRGQGYILDTALTIGYDTPWRQVEAMLLEAARRTEGVLDQPPPRVFQTGLSDFYVEYRLVCQAIPAQPRPRAEVMHMLHAHVLDVFNENGVQITSPHYFADPDTAKVVPKSQWYAAPARKPEGKSAGA